MKRPKPRDYGLDSDHALVYPVVTDALPIDPAQPFTQEELHAALTRVVEREALAARRRRYVDAVHEFDYNNGGR